MANPVVANALDILRTRVHAEATSAASDMRALIVILFGIRKNASEHADPAKCPVCARIVKIVDGVAAALGTSHLPAPALCRHITVVVRELSKLAEHQRSHIPERNKALIVGLCERAIQHLSRLEMATHKPTFRDVLG